MKEWLERPKEKVEDGPLPELLEDEEYLASDLLEVGKKPNKIEITGATAALISEHYTRTIAT